jgi:hypothetical protein
MYRIVGADGQQYGPVSAEQLRQWMTEGRVNLQTRAQAEGASEWKPLAEFAEFAPTTASAPPPLTPTATVLRPHVPNHLVSSILVTLFCCLPFGIPAIVYAAQVNGKLQAGDVAGAQESSRKARMWCWASVIGWAIVTLGYILIFGGMAMGGRWRRF